MPELPELEVVSEVLRRRVVGQTINADLARRGKFLKFTLKPTDLFLVINPKLTGRLQLASPTDKRMPKTHVVFALTSGDELRYVDMKRMGQLYLTRDPDEIPDYVRMGPEPFDVSLDEFRARIKPF